MGVMDTYRVTSDIKWSDVVGMEAAKNRLTEYVILPLRFPQMFKGARSERNIILVYGFPGCGKTHIVKAAVNEIPGCVLYHLSAYDLRASTLKKMRQLVTEANEHSSCIILLDDPEVLFDAESKDELLHRARHDLLDVLKWEHHRAETIIIFCSNDPDHLTASFRYRMRTTIFIDLPTTRMRAGIMGHHLHEADHDLSQDDIDEIAIKTQGWTPSDIVCLVRGSLMSPIREIGESKYFHKVARKAVTLSGKCQCLSEMVWAPCGADEKDAVCMSFEDTFSDNNEDTCTSLGHGLYIRPINFVDMVVELNKSCSSVDVTQQSCIKAFHIAKGQDYEYSTEAEESSLKHLCRSAVLKLLQPAFLLQTSTISDKFTLLDKLPIPRTLKLYLLLENEPK